MLFRWSSNILSVLDVETAEIRAENFGDGDDGDGV